MAVPPPAKAALRRMLRTRRQAHVARLSDERRAEAGHAAARHAISHLAAARVVALYAPLGDEIGTFALAALLAGRALALPHVTGRDDVPRFLAWAPGDALVAGPFGLMQPAAGKPAVAPDAIVTPLLGFDAALHRLGQGAGHYDRAFVRYPGAYRIGLAWAIQQCDNIPCDAWDVALHAVATERGSIA